MNVSVRVVNLGEDEKGPWERHETLVTEEDYPGYYALLRELAWINARRSHCSR